MVAGWRSLFTSKGRSARKRFWAVTGILFGVVVACGLLAMAMGSNDILGLVAAIIVSPVMIAVIVANVNNYIKRLHDLGLSGWWLLAIVAVNLVFAFLALGATLADKTAGPNPISGLANLVGFIELILLGSLPGAAGDNRYGPSPIASRAEEVIA